MIINLFLLLISTTNNLISDCPEIITKQGWGGRPAKNVTSMATPVPYVVIHHSATSPCTTTASCISAMQEIQNYHMDIKGWDDIGYNFVIGGDGRVYEGRGWKVVGAQAPKYNDKSIGICLIGDFTEKLPMRSQLRGAKSLMKCGVEEKFLDETYVLFGHREVRPTECPGDVLFEEIRKWPHKGSPKKL